MPESAHDGRDETPLERLDRNWDERLQELRVVQTGVQILAGFLLALPFQQRFTEVEQANRVVFLVALALAVSAVAFVIFDVVTGTGVAIAAAALLLFVVNWLGLPLTSLRRDQRRPDVR